MPVQRGSHRPHRTSLGVLLVLLLLAPPAAATQQAPAAVEDERSTASLAAPPTDTTPLLADFDGDNRTDLFWYGPGGRADQAELKALRVYYPLQNYVLALYHTQAQNRYDDAEAITFVRRNRTPAAMMWAGDRNPALSLAANGRQGRRFRQSFANGLRAAGAVVYVHSLGDPAQIQRFWDLGIGVYSNDPFPPLGGAATVLETPQFGPRTNADTPPA